MRVNHFPAGYPVSKIYPNQRLYGGLEGGAIYVAEKDDHYYLIMNEGTLASILDLDEKDELFQELVTIYEFDTDEEREQFLVERNLKRFKLGRDDRW